MACRPTLHNRSTKCFLRTIRPASLLSALEGSFEIPLSFTFQAPLEMRPASSRCTYCNTTSTWCSSWRSSRLPPSTSTPNANKLIQGSSTPCANSHSLSLAHSVRVCASTGKKSHELRATADIPPDPVFLSDVAPADWLDCDPPERICPRLSNLWVKCVKPCPIETTTPRRQGDYSCIW